MAERFQAFKSCSENKLVHSRVIDSCVFCIQCDGISVIRVGIGPECIAGSTKIRRIRRDSFKKNE